MYILTGQSYYEMVKKLDLCEIKAGTLFKLNEEQNINYNHKTTLHDDNWLHCLNENISLLRSYLCVFLYVDNSTVCLSLCLQGIQLLWLD